MTDDAVTSIVEGNIPADLEGFDIGPKTCELYKAEIAKAKTIIWNGPMGVFEKKPFQAGTQGGRAGGGRCDQQERRDHDHRRRRLARRRSSSSGSRTRSATCRTGGGASLEFLENGHFSTLDILD